MQLTIASGNKKKLNEMIDILKDTEFEIVGIKPEEDIEVIEDALTFEGNAKLKALAYAKHLNKVVVSDDSGICVDKLDGRPGIYSKRYSGKTDHDNNLKLLEELDGETDRTAFFVCLIAVGFPDGKTFVYEGRWYGKIAYEITGVNGFGYDPIFIPENMNDAVANLPSDYKKTHSHRNLALQKLLEAKDEIIDYWRYSWKK